MMCHQSAHPYGDMRLVSALFTEPGRLASALLAEHISANYTTNFAFYGIKIRHEMTKNWSHYGDGRLASALIKIVAYWRMPPSFPDQKIDLFKKKVCPNRTIRSKVTSFFKITKCTRTFHSWPKNVKTRWSDLGKFFEIGLFFQPETMKASSNSQHFLELGGTH